MSNPTFKDAVDTVNEIHRVQSNQEETRTDDYMRGMLNGIEVVRASLTCTDGNFMNRNGKLDKELTSE
jgi:hypothetical protein|tara:strand:+ start:879 stop:1082 length:204 start_codon:yes stop_codon:yes gene_type:complete